MHATLEIQTPVGSFLHITKKNGEQVVYTLVEEEIKLNEQQFNLPEGNKLTYDDGMILIHMDNYGLIRHLNGFDRLAFHWNKAVKV